MRILQVMAGGEHGGAETAFADMCLAMHEAGQEIEVVTRRNARNEPLIKAGIKVHMLPFGGKIDVYTKWAMAGIIKAFKPEIVQTWMARAPHKTPRWSPSMGIPRYEVFARLGNYYNLKYFKSADYFITITPDIRTYLIDHGVAPERVRHINNFAEVEHVETPIDRAAYGVPSGATLLLGLGRLHTAKAFDTLIKAVAELPDIYLWIAGEGPQREELEALIAELNVGSRVTLLGWRSDRAALFQACDICVFSSRYEPFGTVFVQAWAQKVPLITTDADGPRQFVRPGEDGLVIPIDDLAAFKRAISGLSQDESLREKLVENGYQRYLHKFTKEKCVQEYLDFYAFLQSEKPAKSAA